MKKFLLALSLPILLSVPAHAANLSGEELESAFVGKRLSFATADGFEGTVRYNKNGSAKVTIKKPERVTDKGSWRINGNKICNQWENIRNGTERCFTYKKEGNRTYRSNTGTVVKAGFF